MIPTDDGLSTRGTYARGAFWLLLLLLIPSFPPATAQQAGVQPETGSITEGIPAIPSSMVAEVGRYTNIRAAEILGWHPVRREMLIVTFLCNTPQVHLVKSPGGARTQLTFFEDRTSRGVSYQPTRGDYFIFSKDSGGDQNYQNHRYDVATGQVTLLTDGKSKNGPGVWSSRGDRIAYSSTRRNGTDVDLYVVNPLDPKSDRLLVELQGGGWSPLDWAPDDSTILALQEISISESYLWLIEVSSGKKTMFTPKDGANLVAYGDAHFSKDGKSIYAITDRDSDFRRLARIDIATHRYTFLTAHIPWDISEAQLSPDGKMIAVTSNEDGVTTLHLLDAVSGREKSLPGFPAGYVIDLHWHRNSRDLGFSLDSARSSDDAYSLDTKTGKVERWTFSELGGLHTEGFVDPRVIHWKSFDDKIISGILYRPPARFTGKRPVIVDIHGGPEDQFQPYFLGQQNYYLNELGVALLFPNIRGSSGFGKAFVNLDNGSLRENAYKDIGSLLDWIGTQPDLDAGRVMVTGASYGGNVALVTAMKYPGRIRCAVDIYGPSNLVTFLERTAPYRRDLRRVEYGDERDPEMRAFLERLAPLNSAGSITSPLFVMQGENDPIVARSESDQIVNAVRKNGVPVWYFVAKSEGHGFSKKSNNDYRFYAMVMFVKKFLLN
ncbi:MAG TPA: prolyl oligopeptidase family serine peptidase [Candidatus Angelobacter sp.]|nr:prolyl oligopeptidase family serine peptidase [Candidatus Angelobacter sp.]